MTEIELEEQSKVDSLKELETKQKVITELKKAFQKQKNILCETKLAFNFDKGVKDIRAGMIQIGATREHRTVAK